MNKQGHCIWGRPQPACSKKSPWWHSRERIFIELRLPVVCMAILLAGCCTSRNGERVAITPPDAPKTMVDAIGRAIAIDSRDAPLPPFAAHLDPKHFQAYRFYDPHSYVHPRYYDRIRNVDLRQIERTYLNYIGEVSRSEVITLPESKFWEPVEALAQYYTVFKSFPLLADLRIPELKNQIRGALEKAAKSKT